MKYFIFLCMFLIACVNAPNGLVANAVLPDAPVSIEVIEKDSLYAMIITNVVDSLDEATVTENFLNLINSRDSDKDKLALAQQFEEVMGMSYVAARNASITAKFNGNWLMGTDTIKIEDGATETGKINFISPNLLVVPVPGELVYFTVKENAITAAVGDEVVHLRKL